MSSLKSSRSPTGVSIGFLYPVSIYDDVLCHRWPNPLISYNSRRILRAGGERAETASGGGRDHGQSDGICPGQGRWPGINERSGPVSAGWRSRR